MNDAKNKTSQKEVSQFRMGETKEFTQTTGKGKTNPSVKTRLIVQAGGYGGFKKRYGRDPFQTSNEQAKGILGRNQKCFCNSGKKYKKCCLR
jgi:uncharacterized protein YecA (UPF0149 family)